jgi:hypothetical protein
LRNSRLRCSSAIAVVGKHSSGCGAQLNVARAPCTSRRGFAMRARRPAHEAPALSPPIVPAVVHTSWRRRRSMAGGAPADPSLSRRSAVAQPRDRPSLSLLARVNVYGRERLWRGLRLPTSV